MPPKDNSGVTWNGISSIYIHTNDGAEIELEPVTMAEVTLAEEAKDELVKFPMNFANPQECEITFDGPKISFRLWVKLLGFWRAVRLYFQRLVRRIKNG